MLATVFFLLRAGEKPRSAGLAGLCCVLMLAIGMETVPYVAAAGLVVAGWFLFKGEEAAGAAASFGAAFAATSAAVFVATVPSAQWTSAYCDAYSVVQFVDRRHRRAGALGSRLDPGIAHEHLAACRRARPARRLRRRGCRRSIFRNASAIPMPACRSC